MIGLGRGLISGGVQWMRDGDSLWCLRGRCRLYGVGCEACVSGVVVDVE